MCKMKLKEDQSRRGRPQRMRTKGWLHEKRRVSISLECCNATVNKRKVEDVIYQRQRLFLL